MRRSRLLRARSVFASALVGFVAACGFGVDLDGIFASDNVNEAGTDGSNDASIDGAIPKAQVVQIGVGDEFACGRRIDGTVMCWGSGGSGKLGDNLETSSSQPVLVKDVSDAIDLSVGRDHACVVKRDATVVCWGYNGDRQIGDGSTTNALVPRAVVGLTDVTQVAAGGRFSCALKKDGTVQCWGNNGSGQLGDNTQNFRGTPAPVVGLADVTQIALAYEGACALVKSGDVLCWGDNSEGLSGLGTSGDDTLVPTKVPGLTGVASLGHGPTADHFCAVLAAGGARCWGNADSGQIGHAKSEDFVNTPTPVVGIVDAAKITMGSYFTCALRKTGTVSCWGTNGWHQLGIGDTNAPGSTTSPIPLDTLSGIDQVAAGSDFACALHAGGEHISCWGSNRSASLGRNTRLASEVPLKVPNLTATSVGMGRYHTCVVDAQGAIWCWGLNDYRQQASSDFTATATPTKVAAIGGAQKIIGGELHTCGLFGTDVKCWGHNSYGTLGRGSTNYIETDPDKFLSTAATDVNAGYLFTCALLATKEVACAGYNDDGRLGSDGPNASTPRIVQVPNPAAGDAGVDAGDAGPPPSTISFADVSRLGVGRLHSCAVYGGGKIACWGTPDEGRLGIATGSSQTSPVDVTLPMSATDVACGFDHSCAVLVDGSIRCWGANDSGQASGGGGGGPQLRTPNLNGKQAKTITAGGAHSCALFTDGTVACWGRGREGQLGQGMRVDATQPVTAQGLAGVVSLDAEENRTCAVTTDGSIFCWGDNRDGTLGDGTLMVIGVPGAVIGY